MPASIKTEKKDTEVKVFRSGIRLCAQYAPAGYTTDFLSHLYMSVEARAL